MTQKYGYRANEAEGARTGKACLVCDEPRPVYSWTDYHGEGYCIRCGTPYQLKGGELKEGEDYPRCNVREEWIPVLRKYYAETGCSNGGGQFMITDDYSNLLKARVKFNVWCDAHSEELPPLREIN